jgi:hypothetical protein
MTDLTNMVRTHPIKSVLLASLSGAILGFLGLPERTARPPAKNASLALLAMILEAAADRVKTA